MQLRKKWWMRRIGDFETDFSAGVYNAPDYPLRLYWFDADFSRSIRILPLWEEGIVLQVGLDMRTVGWGRVGLRVYYDLPQSSSSREITRTITLIYRFY